MSDDDRLARQLTFLLEADRLKQVERQTAVIGGSRRENTAEHSWHLGLFALVLGEHADEAVDLARVVAMVLVHDLVEIDAGDTFAYDEDRLRDQGSARAGGGRPPVRAAARRAGAPATGAVGGARGRRDGRRPLRQRARPPATRPPEPRRRRRRAVGAPRRHLRADRPAQCTHRRRLRGAVGGGSRADHGRGGARLGGRPDAACWSWHPVGCVPAECTLRRSRSERAFGDASRSQEAQRRSRRVSRAPRRRRRPPGRSPRR